MKFRIYFCAIAAATRIAAQNTVDGVAHFESTVLPVLRNNCLACHSDKNVTSGLSLQSRDAIVRGGNRGADPKVILEAVRQSGELKMPPGKKLKDEQIAAIDRKSVV